MTYSSKKNLLYRLYFKILILFDKYLFEIRAKKLVLLKKTPHILLPIINFDIHLNDFYIQQ